MTPTPKEFVNSILDEGVEHAQVSVTVTGNAMQIHRALKHMSGKKGGKAMAKSATVKDLSSEEEAEKEEKTERVATAKPKDVKESAQTSISKLLGKG